MSLVICYALYVADEPGPVNDDDGVCATCVAIFGEVEDAIAEARARLVVEGRSVSIDIGVMTNAEWDALEEVPDDFRFKPHPSVAASDPHAEAGERQPQRASTSSSSPSVSSHD